MNILVVGAGGFVGRRLCARLTESGCVVTAMSSQSGSGVDPDSGTLRPDFSIPPGTRVVYYLAASPDFRKGVAAASHVFAVNTFSAMAVAARAMAVGVKRFVYASTGNVYASSFAPLAEGAALRRDELYALSKVHAEEALALLRPKIDVVVARLFTIYGPMQKDRLVANLVAAVHAGRPITLHPRPDNPDDRDGLRLSVCHVDDAAAILAWLGANGGPAILNVASDEVISVKEIAETAGALLGRRPTIAVSEKPRGFDLVADVQLLRSKITHQFVPFSTGLAATVRAAVDAGV